jgi:hypothetical protein
MSSLAAEMSNASSRSDNEVRSCSRGSCGSSAIMPEEKAAPRSRDDIDRVAKGGMHEVKKAETDFVV